MASDEGPRFVKLISSEGHEFLVERRVAYQAKALKMMLSGGFMESNTNECRLNEIATDVLEKVIQYLHYKDRYSDSMQPIPEFPIEPEMVSSILMASNFLDC